MNKEFRTTLEAYVKEYSPYVNIILIAHVQAPRGHLNEHQIQFSYSTYQTVMSLSPKSIV